MVDADVDIDPNRPRRVLAVAIFFLCLTPIAVALRLYSKVFITRTVTSDDKLLCLLQAVFTVFLVTEILGVVHGTGRDATQITPEDRRKALQVRCRLGVHLCDRFDDKTILPDCFVDFQRAVLLCWRTPISPHDNPPESLRRHPTFAHRDRPDARLDPASTAAVDAGIWVSVPVPRRLPVPTGTRILERGSSYPRSLLLENRRSRHHIYSRHTELHCGLGIWDIALVYCLVVGPAQKDQNFGCAVARVCFNVCFPSRWFGGMRNTQPSAPVA